MTGMFQPNPRGFGPHQAPDSPHAHVVPVCKEVNHARVILDCERFILIYGKKSAPIRKQNLFLLECLARNAGRTVPISEIFRAVWPATHCTKNRHNLETAIGRLRTDARDLGCDLDISAVRNVGYRLDTPVEIHRAPHVPADIAPDVIAALAGHPDLIARLGLG